MSKPKQSKPLSRTARPARKRATQADAMHSTREAHARETIEDYAEAIAELTAAQGEARVTDLARKFGVTHVTVNRTIVRLQQGGFVTAQPYRSIFLTEAGREIATKSKSRHETVLALLRQLGVPEEAALRDAEGIEHHVSPETLKAFERALAKDAAGK